MWSYLDELEAEAIYIIREAVAVAENPVMMYSIGKDSSVILHLAMKAFYPMKPPFPLLHIDTTWKFREMIAFRDKMARESGLQVLVHTNPEGLALGVTPFSHGSARYTEIMKTEALKQALTAGKFDIVMGGARRDEEKSRAKERIFSFRDSQQRWDPKNQRPELWKLFNTRRNKNESVRVFPISNWTELDVWRYIIRENIPVVPLYLSQPRPVVEREGQLFLLDDDRFPLLPGEQPQTKMVRFRTLGCYPLTAAVESQVTTLQDLLAEMEQSRLSELSGRLIDHDQAGSMEKRSRRGTSVVDPPRRKFAAVHHLRQRR